VTFLRRWLVVFAVGLLFATAGVLFVSASGAPASASESGPGRSSDPAPVSTTLLANVDDGIPAGTPGPASVSRVFLAGGGFVHATEEGAGLEATPAGRPYSAHYLNDTGPVRNIPGSVVDETIDHGQAVEQLGDRTVYYDAKNDVTVVQSDMTGKIMSVRRGAP
jgi:hypothetical protein